MADDAVRMRADIAMGDRGNFGCESFATQANASGKQAEAGSGKTGGDAQRGARGPMSRGSGMRGQAAPDHGR